VQVVTGAWPLGRLQKPAILGGVGFEAQSGFILILLNVRGVEEIRQVRHSMTMRGAGRLAVPAATAAQISRAMSM
jgi:hypothetical protein